MKYKVRIQPAGMELSITDDVSILESAINSNVYLEHSCMDGSCGACKAKLLQGEVKQLGGSTGLSEGEINDGYILTCCTQAASDIEILAEFYPELASITKSIHPCKVDEISFPADDVAILKLKLPASASFEYIAGQHVQLIIKGERRSYSIANISDTYAGIELHIRKVTKGVFSEIIFNELKLNQLLRMEGGIGTFFVRKSDAPIIFLAGGTGFAPIKSMVEQLIKDHTKRDICIYWGASTVDGFYSDLADNWMNQYENVKYVPVLSGNDRWDGRKGLVHEAVLEDIESLSLYEVYACGSPKMIEVARSDFVSNGLIPGKFYSDAFVASN